MHFCQTLSEFSPPKPTFTEKDLPDLSGKVYFITGATSGIGLCLAKILYSKNAKIYITSRSDTSAEKAISQIRDSDKASRGEVKHVVLDLSDLPTIAPAIKKFLAQEPLLHSVWYNAGVMNVPKGSISAQGYELHWGTNVVAHFIINKLLMPALISAAHVSPKGSVRAVWVSSDGHAFSPSGDGIDWKDITTKKSTGWKGEKGSMTYYGQSKAGNVILAMEEAKRYGKSDILSVSLNPGHLKTNLQRHTNGILSAAGSLLSFDPHYGALTELYAGFSESIGFGINGAYIIPWGRIGKLRQDVENGFRTKDSGTKLWNILEQETEQYCS